MVMTMVMVVMMLTMDNGKGDYIGDGDVKSLSR